MNASIATQDSHELATSNASTFLAQERSSSIAQPKSGSSGDKFRKSNFSPSTPLPLNRLCWSKNGQNCAKFHTHHAMNGHGASVGWKGLLWTRDTLKQKQSSNITVVTSMVAPNTFLTIGKDLCSAKIVPSKSFTKWLWSAHETSKMPATMWLRFGNALISTISKKSAKRTSWKEGSPGSQSASPPRLGSLFTSWRSCRCSNFTAISSTSILTGGISSWSRWTPDSN